jgi:hypothetical protein
VAAFLLHAHLVDFLSDDAFITFRYSRNLANGLGLVFNPGERVEGYTNFLLVLILAGLHSLGSDLVVAGRIVSALSGGAMVVLTALLVRRLEPGRPFLALLASVLVAASPYVAAWGGAGLETTLFGALLLALLILGCAPPRDRAFLGASAVALLLALARPEGALVYVVFSLWYATRVPGSIGQRLRSLAPGMLLFVVLGGGYFAARWTYFGALLPNTYYAKGAFTAQHATQGLLYLGRFFSTAPAALATSLAAVGLVALRRRRQVAVPMVAVTMVVWVALEGGDGLAMYRFMVPLIPLISAMAVVGAAAVLDCARLGLARWGGVAILLLAAASSPFPPRDSQYQLYRFQRDEEIPRWSAVGRALARVLPAGSTVAAVPIGALGWYSDLRILDMAGLTDPVIARGPADPAINWTGHRKHNGRYVLSRRPSVILLGNINVDREPSRPDGVFQPFANPALRAREGDIVNEPEFAAEYEPASLPIGDGAFLHAFVRRDVLGHGGSAGP